MEKDKEIGKKDKPEKNTVRNIKWYYCVRVRDSGIVLLQNTKTFRHENHRWAPY
jgi:hypothetical protein